MNRTASVHCPGTSSVRRGTARRRNGLILNVALGVSACWASFGIAADPTLTLPPADRQTIEDVLGVTVITQALPAPRLAEPTQFLNLSAVPRTYQVRGGDGASETHLWVPIDSGPARSLWRYRAGDTETALVEREADGSYGLTGVEDLREKALTRYRPSEPLLLQGMRPGEQRNRRLDVAVYDPANPASLRHQGALDVAYRYLGAYRIKIPSGVYDTVLTKSEADGDIGLAHLHDLQYRFFAKGVGLVASVESRDVTAAVVYHSELRLARVLAETTQHAECSGLVVADNAAAPSVC